MKRLIYCATLLLTFVIGISVNALVLRAAYYYIPDFDPQTVHTRTQPEVFIECGRNRHLKFNNSR